MPSVQSLNPNIEDFKIIDAGDYSHVAVIGDFVLKLHGMPYLGGKAEAELSIRLACDGSLAYYLSDASDLPDSILAKLN